MGTLDVDAMLAGLAPELMDEWQAFDRLEPVGPRKLYEVLARCASGQCAAWGAAVDPEQFIPDPYGELARGQSDAEQQAQCRKAARLGCTTFAGA